MASFFQFGSNICPSTGSLIHRPENFCDAALLFERRELELLKLERPPVYGGRERADGNLHSAFHEPITYHYKRKKLRQNFSRFCPHDHRVRRTNAVKLRYCKLALIRTAAAKNDVALTEAELRANHIACL